MRVVWGSCPPLFVLLEVAGVCVLAPSPLRLSLGTPTLARRNAHGVDERTICRQAAQPLKKPPSEWRENVLRVRKGGSRYVRIPVGGTHSSVRAQ